MTIDGTKWKTIIIASMERAKQLGDSSQYSDVSIEVDANRAKISATRYALSSCFTDDRFYMIVESSADEQLQIVEQFMETPTKTECKDADAKAEAELPEFLKTTVSMINEQLPAAIDAETQLVRTSSEGSKLIYHYLLINHTSESLTTEEVTAKLEPMIVKQSCTSPNLRPILDQKGSVTYIYRGSDAKQIAKFDVDLSACSG